MRTRPVGGEIFQPNSPVRDKRYEHSYTRRTYSEIAPVLSASRPPAPKPKVIHDVFTPTPRKPVFTKKTQQIAQPRSITDIKDLSPGDPSGPKSPVLAHKSRSARQRNYGYASSHIGLSELKPDNMGSKNHQVTSLNPAVQAVREDVYVERREEVVVTAQDNFLAEDVAFRTQNVPVQARSSFGWLKQTASYLGITAVAIGAGFAIPNLQYGQWLIGAYALAALILRINSQVTFMLAMMTLVSVPVTSIIGQEIISENFAVYSFLLLCVGVLSAIVELALEGRNQENSTPKFNLNR